MRMHMHMHTHWGYQHTHPQIERLEQAIAEQDVLLSEAQRKKAVSETQLSQLTARCVFCVVV